MTQTALAFDNFFERSDEECIERIAELKALLGERVLILGHHYQREEVYQFADITGDSLGLSQKAVEAKAKNIVFCGVHFMAEVADILTNPDQEVSLPDLAAGCSMADMANIKTVEKCWRELSAVIPADEKITPITYINSAADLKAFCGRHGGIICTSSNAEAVIKWGFEQREKILFFPDQHLGRNTCYQMGIPLDDMVVWDFMQPNGGLTDDEIRKAKVILWAGHCSVHQMFKPEHIKAYKARYPETKVIAHPESSFEVCQQSDVIGSTAKIIKTVRESEPGSRWLVATELNLVNRLAKEQAQYGKTVTFMSPNVCMCSTMFRTDPQHLCWVMENLAEGVVVNRIHVPEPVASEARIALERMFEVS